MGKTTQISQALSTIGFETKGNLIFGSWKSWCVDLYPWSGMAYFLDIAVRIDPKNKERIKEIKKELKACGSKAKFYSVTDKKITFSIPFKKKGDLYDQQFLTFMGEITRVLQNVGIGPADTCVVCGGGTPRSMCCLDGYQPVHKTCLTSVQEKAKDAVDQNQENGSYLTGIVGAVLGTIVGLIPNFLTIWFGEVIYAVLFALVPLAAMWGYTKFNGKKSKVSIVIVVLLSFISVFVLQYAVAAVTVMNEYGLGFGETMDSIFEIFGNLEGIIFTMQESVTEFLFMLIGILVAWKNISNTNASTLKDIEQVMETVRPNPNFTENLEEEQE